jgi:hypothetical protein
MRDAQQGSSSWPPQRASPRQKTRLGPTRTTLNAPEVARTGYMTFVLISDLVATVGILIARQPAFREVALPETAVATSGSAMSGGADVIGCRLLAKTGDRVVRRSHGGEYTDPEYAQRLIMELRQTHIRYSESIRSSVFGASQLSIRLNKRQC